MKSILSFAICYLLSATILFSQEAGISDSKNNSHSKFSAGVVFIPAYTYRQLTIDNSNSFAPFVAASRDEKELPSLNYSVGAGVNMELSRKFALECDVLYSVKGYKYDLSGLVWGDMIDPRFGFIYQTFVLPYTLKSIIYDYSYIDVPIKLNYIICGNKFQLLASAGVVSSFFISAMQMTEKEITGTGESEFDFRKLDDPFTKLSFSGSAGVGVTYNVSDHFRISMTPEFQYSLTKLLSEDYPINEHLWSAGLDVGTYYRF